MRTSKTVQQAKALNTKAEDQIPHDRRLHRHRLAALAATHNEYITQ